MTCFRRDLALSPATCVSTLLCWATFLLAIPAATQELAADGADDAPDTNAPEAAPSDGADPARVTAPKLVHFVEAAYPHAAVQARIEGTVVLLIAISEVGSVTSVHVLEGLGHGLDEAAKEASLHFLFTPAMQRGAAKAARIRYSYEFRLPSEEAAPFTPPEGEPSVAAPPVAVPPTAGLPAADPNATDPSVAVPSSPPPPERDTAPTPQETVDILVRGLRPADEKLRSSAAVTVVDLERAKRESADLAEVLARVEGVNVQRMGGLGSEARFSLSGFDDNQIRFFIDGIPLEYQGFSMGLQNVPLSFAERIDVYKGVVPVTLGADSLGGAFNVITNRKTRGTGAFASYQGGSFDTHRFTLGARHLDEATGLFIKTEGFLDSTENDYAVVVVGDRGGDPVDITVRRTHDAYHAKGVNLETGFVNRKWADRLLLKGFYNTYDKQLQHNALMTLPFAEAEYGGVAKGLSVRFEDHLGRGLSTSLVAGYVRDETWFVDHPECINDWYGQCIIPARGRGETKPSRTDQVVWDDTFYGRWSWVWDVARDHTLSLSIAPTFFTREGDNNLLSDTSNFNELKAQRDMFKWINGVEYNSRLFDERLENSLFAKAYLLASQSEEIYNDYIETLINTQDVYGGFGDGARFAFNEWASVKASYEYAVRLPEPRETFGNTVQIVENLKLQPERSHNVNLSFLITNAQTRLGLYNANLTGFFRDAHQLILLTGSTDAFRYENAYDAQVYGVEGGGAWLVPGDFLELGVNATYQEYVNLSREGHFEQFEGDRIPNKPYLFGNATLRLFKQGVSTPRDELAFTWYSRYVHEFLRGWESVSSNYEQPEVPSQLVHTAVLSYVVRGAPLEELAFTAEGQNLTNEKVFDFYRVQKPGRAVYVKMSATY